MTAPSSFKFALACGSGGAYVDVTNDVLFEEGSIPFTEGRTSQFDSPGPGVWSFTLADGDGKYTPDHPQTSLAVALSEGMGAVMELDGQLFSGTIRSATVIFPPLLAASEARVRVTVDDMLGNAARRALGVDLYTATVDAGFPYLSWPLSDPAGSTSGEEIIVGRVPMIGSLDYAFGAHSNIPVPTTHVRIGDSASWITTYGGGFTLPNPPLVYDQASIGAWGFWIERDSSTAEFAFVVLYAGVDDGFANTFNIRSFSGDLTMRPGVGTRIIGPEFTPGQAFYCAVEVATSFAAGEWTLTYTFYVDGISYGSSDYVHSAAIPVTSLTNADRQPKVVRIQDNGGDGNFWVSRISHTATVVNEYVVAPSTADVRLQAIAATVPELLLDTIPTMSPAIYGEQGDVSGSALDAFNEVMRAEQGYMWAETTGTLTAPLQKVKILPRERERDIDYTFDVSEILDPVPLIRSLSNTISQFTANGTDTTVTYQDSTLVPIVGSASSSDSVPLRDFNDLEAYASDRVRRGVVDGIPVQAITIDATSPLIDRWDDFSEIRQGHRLHITGLPESQLGYGTWDGFVVGREIVSTQDPRTDEPRTLFTYHLAPWSPIAVFDTAVYQSDGELTLSSSANASTTSLSVATSGVKLTTTNLPLTIQIDDEQMTVTAATGATPQVFTVTRGVNGTTAASHSSGASVTVTVPADTFAY